MRYIQAIYDYFKRSAKDDEYEYLAASTDLVELERRMRQIDRGHAPFQRTLKIFYM